MSRRFLTAEDVRRHGGGPLQVDADTVVTYQAREVASELGVELVSGAAPYAEPAPDRGPDADVAARHLPNLPEPVDEGTTATGVVVTAVGRNRSGVLAEITAAVGAAGGDVHDISQKTIEGYFHLILVVELPPGSPFGDLKARVECLGGPEDYVVRVMHERVFRFMHRV